MAGAFAAGLVALIAFAVQGGNPANANFAMTAYQGASELGGSNVQFSDVKLHASGKPIALNFWGGSCPPCRAEMPGFQRVYERHEGEFLMLGIDVGPFLGLGTRNSALRLLDELGITYPTAYAASRDALVAFGVTGLPATFFFDGNGDLVGNAPGFIDERAFELRVRQLIGTAAAGVAP